MENIEDIRLMAEYDGWERNGIHGLYSKEFKNNSLHLFDYATNIASLWPVAKRVYLELDKLLDKTAQALSDEPFSNPDAELQKKYDYIERRMNSILRANNTFDVTALFAATVAGIKLLNEYKNK